MALVSAARMFGSGLLRQSRAIQAASTRTVTTSPSISKASEPAMEEDSDGEQQMQIGQARVGDILSSKAMDNIWIKQDDLVLDAVRKMAQLNVGSLLVGDESKMRKNGVAADAVIGIITERDYLTKVMVTGKSSASIKVSSIMTPATQLRSLTPQHSVLEAMELMVDNNVRHVPVIDKDRVLGMLSIRDVVKVVVGEHREQLSQMRDYITGSY